MYSATDTGKYFLFETHCIHWYLSDKRTERVLKKVLPPFFPRDHQPVENIIEGERDNVVQPEDGGGGQDRGVDNEDGEEEENEAEERPGHEVA